MKSIVLKSPGILEIEASQGSGSPGPGQALVRTKRVGICGTDLHAYKGDFPFMSYPRILGHELCVEIIALGEPVSADKNTKVGDLCAVEPYMNCEVCRPCSLGLYNCCTDLEVIGVHRDGGMTDEFLIPVSKLHVANGIDPSHSAIVEMLAIGAHAVSRVEKLDGQKVVVVGMGPIGLGVANFAKLAGADLVVVDRNRGRLDFASRELDVTGILSSNTLREDLLDELGDLPRYLFDATGNVESMNGSFNLVGHSGEIVFVGLVRDFISFDDPHFHRHELTLKASRNARALDFERVIESLSSGETDVTNWISHTVTPEELVSEIAAWTDPEYGVIKGVVRFD